MAFTLQQRMAALAATPPGAATGGSLPHVCNWVAGKMQQFLVISNMAGTLLKHNTFKKGLLIIVVARNAKDALEF